MGDVAYLDKIKCHIDTHFGTASQKNKIKIFDLLINSNSLDCLYYANKYSDLKKYICETNSNETNSNENLIRHWVMHGVFEGRLCSKIHEELCKILMAEYIATHLSRADIGPIATRTTLNILTRTSSGFMNMALMGEMLKRQKYPYLRHIISYDDPFYENFINLSRIKNSEMVKVSPGKRHNYFYNLYCDVLLSRVREGWVMFLDDDDELVRDDTVRRIMHIVSHYTPNDLLIFHNYREDKIIQIHDRKHPKVGEVCISSFVFHSSMKKLSRFTDTSHGDYDFFKKLFRRLTPHFFDFPIAKINHWS